MISVERIFQLMDDEKLNAKEFAIKTGLSQGNITDWKTGRARPSTDALLKIAGAHNVTVEWLIGSTYFKNNADRSYCLGYAAGIISKLPQKKCALLENFINSQIKKNPSTFIAPDSDELKKYELPISDDKMSKLCNILFYDYKENKDVYALIYGKNEFSIITFLTYTNALYGKGKAKKVMDETISKLQASNVFPLPTDKLYMCPVYGRIAAGIPNWAEQCIEGALPLDPGMMNINNPEECFFLKVSGESMNKIIKNGGYALIRKQDDVDNGDIAVVLVNGYDATLKKFTKKNGTIVLEPMSDDESIGIQIYDHTTQIKILGKYIGKFELN